MYICIEATDEHRLSFSQEKYPTLFPITLFQNQVDSLKISRPLSELNYTILHIQHHVTNRRNIYCTDVHFMIHKELERVSNMIFYQC